MQCNGKEMFFQGLDELKVLIDVLFPGIPWPGGAAMDSIICQGVCLAVI